MLDTIAVFKAILVVLGALLYFLMPLDLFPDMVPYVGYLDDLVILLAAIPSAVKLYSMYKERQAAKTPAKPAA